MDHRCFSLSIVMKPIESCAGAVSGVLQLRPGLRADRRPRVGIRRIIKGTRQSQQPPRSRNAVTAPIVVRGAILPPESYGDLYGQYFKVTDETGFDRYLSNWSRRQRSWKPQRKYAAQVQVDVHSLSVLQSCESGLSPSHTMTDEKRPSDL